MPYLRIDFAPVTTGKKVTLMCLLTSSKVTSITGLPGLVARDITDKQGRYVPQRAGEIAG